MNRARSDEGSKAGPRCSAAACLAPLTRPPLPACRSMRRTRLVPPTWRSCTACRRRARSAVSHAGQCSAAAASRRRHARAAPVTAPEHCSCCCTQALTAQQAPCSSAQAARCHGRRLAGRRRHAAPCSRAPADALMLPPHASASRATRPADTTDKAASLSTTLKSGSREAGPRVVVREPKHLYMPQSPRSRAAAEAEQTDLIKGEGCFCSAPGVLHEAV